jgi:hypothetical protein
MISANIVLSNMNDYYYFQSAKMVSSFLQESDIYPSSQKRINYSDFLYAIMVDQKQVGFVSAYKEEEHDNILNLDLCLLKEYRFKGYGNQFLKQIVRLIEANRKYKREFIIIDRSKAHDDITFGFDIGDNKVLLQNRIHELNIYKVVDSKNKYEGKTQDEGKKI